MKNKIIFKTLMLQGKAGSTIVSMEKTGHVGTADIYTITFNDGSTTEISLENMSAITSVEMTSSTDTEDIYTITCADGSTQTFSVLNHNADIAALSASVSADLSDMADEISTIDARVDNLVTDVAGAETTTLWSGSMSADGGTYTLSESVSNFDFIDIYYDNQYTGVTDYLRIPASKTSAAVYIPYFDTTSGSSNKPLEIGKVALTFSGTSVTVAAAKQYYWDGTSASDATVLNAQNSFPVRIDGVRSSANVNAELADVRVGADGTVYASAGAAVRGQINGVNINLGAIESAFDEDVVNLLLSNYTTGSYIDIDGTIKEQGSLKYASVSIDTDLIGKTIYVSGSAWYSIKPFVFVDQNDNVTYADVPNPAGTPTQHTDIEFKPNKAGTLYINVYFSGSSVQTGAAYYKKLSNLKSDYLPDVADSLDDTTEYNIVNIGTLIDSKLLNGQTGAITDNSGGTNYYVSDYIAVEPDTYYLISTEHFWSNGLYAFYDENKTYISGRNSNTGGTVTKIYNEKIKSPKNAAYLVIGFLYQQSYKAPWLFKGIKNSILPSKKWQNKKWACVGDSLTESYAVTSMHYFEYVSAATGIETVNLGISGTGYARGSDNFMTRALTVPTDSDVVTFFGSGNDSGAGLELGTASDTGTTTLGGCINTAIDNLYSIMPLAQLGIVTPTPWQGNMPLNNGWMERYSNLIVEICKRRSIPCLDLFHCSGLNPNDANVRTLAYSKDNGGGVHPDENGHKLIAPRFKAFLETLLLS